MTRRSSPFEEMERWFDQMRRSTFDSGPLQGVPEFAGSGEYLDSNVSLERVEDGYVVLADLPGFERDEIALRFDDGMLVIDATHDVTEEGNGPEGHTAMRRQRQVDERVRIPGRVDVDAIAASYRNGVLEVHIPTEGSDRRGTPIDIE